MALSDQVVPLYDANGDLYTVLLGADIWRRGSERLLRVINSLEDPAVPRPEPLEDWEMFKQYWDFRYPYNAEVECRHCGAQTNDWTLDPLKPFRLKSAQLGGLVVFHCNACNATVRKKHFKDRVYYEATPPEQGCNVCD